ncbi:C-type lectin domain-containing protein [Caenorhabditis elegans]|uniref:C-type lectin domain-containing protein n=1 Tax=Caenorhabditis elegans TaxID=6239 RepID=Q564U0_CAEEL|nr:C-type lectin domain-containing protein [Caenorhabditis elegans]CAI79191.1 C-type lectin domain-containing protein [Caenorhabditis elegans]|eukprot:NP_001023951.1 C-type LECtin [Caenorhabditis elegans]
MSDIDEIQELQEPSQPKTQPYSEKFKLFMTNHWKNILIGGLAEIIIIVFAFMLTFILAKQPACETVTTSIFHTSTLPSTLTYASSSYSTKPDKSSIATSTTLKPKTLPVTTTSNSLSTHTKLDTTSISATFATMPTPVSGNLTCASGFTYVGNKCWKLVTVQKNRADADQACFSLGGSTLFSIRNDQDNQAVLEFLKDQHVENLWTGLNCVGINPFTCTWDVKSGTTSAYNNFADGYPNNMAGGCIYYKTTGTQAGQWSSGSCNEIMSFVCELPATIYDSTCKYNYNNYCYTPYDQLQISSDAQSICASSGSNLATIHSANENRFFMGIFPSFSMIALGGVALSGDKVIWYDGTPSTYTNIRTLTRGNCILLSNDVGRWDGYKCMIDRAKFICKRRIIGK